MPGTATRAGSVAIEWPDGIVEAYDVVALGRALFQQ
jgi:hypothetical protein